MQSLHGNTSIARWARHGPGGWFRRLVVVPLVALVMLFAFPAVAEATGGTGGGGGVTWSTTYCVMYTELTGVVVLTYGVNDGRIIYNPPYVGCNGYPAPAPGQTKVYPANGYETGAYGLCVSDFLEYRFYGTSADPTATWSLGYISLPKVCTSAAGGQVNPAHWTWDAFSPTPIDLYDSGGGGLGPASTPANNPFMASQYVNGSGQVVAHDKNPHPPARLMESQTFLQTSLNSSRTCSGLVNSTPNHVPAGTSIDAGQQPVHGLPVRQRQRTGRGSRQGRSPHGEPGSHSAPSLAATGGIWSTNPVRHEAPPDRAEMKGLCLPAVAAA